MYNAEQKYEYLNSISYDSVKNVVELTFKRINSYEENINKDASNFTTKEIIDLYKSLFVSSYNSIYNINLRLKTYTEWCIKYNLVNDNQNHYDEISSEIIKDCMNKTCIERTILTRKELIDVLKDMKNPRDKVLCLAVFENLCDTKMESVRNATIDNLVAPGKFRMNNGEIKDISAELYHYMLEALETDSYYSGSYVLKFIKSNKIIKNVDKNLPSQSEIISFSTLRMMMNRFCKENDTECLTVNNLKVAGILHDLNCYLKENNMTAAELYENKCVEDFKKKYNRKKIILEGYLELYTEVYED